MIEIPHPRLPLAQLPTPLERADRLSQAWGGPTIWFKRDDLTGFGLSGNKVRKLEFHFAAAQAAGAQRVVTCGAVQSNHCRATALAAARLGFGCTLFVRSPGGEPPETIEGNHLLQKLAGAEVRYLSGRDYASERGDRMAAAAGETSPAAWVIPEGASDELGMWSFAMAFDEVMAQAEAEGIGNPVLWHASSSGGTTAGLSLGAGSSDRATRIVATSVGETVAELAERIASLRATAPGAPWNDAVLIDRYVGDGYGVTSDAELEVQAEATRLTGLLWDPTYTGKALFGLRQEISDGVYGPNDNVIFWHTGGGFATFAHDWSCVL